MENRAEPPYNRSSDRLADAEGASQTKQQRAEIAAVHPQESSNANWSLIMGRTLLNTIAVGVVAISCHSAWAQTSSQGNTNVQGSGNAGATLSSRFDSDSSRFTGGSSSESGVIGTGTTQAGLNTVTNGNAAGGRGFVTSLGGFGGGLGGFGGGLGGFGRGGFGGFGQQGQGQTQTQIRTRMTLGFRPSMPVARVVATRSQERVNRSKRITRLTSISVMMEGQVAILEGTVGSEHDRKLVGHLVSFEPGVRAVENRLIVGAVPEELPSTPSLDSGR